MCPLPVASPTGTISFFGNIEFYVNDNSENVDIYAGEFVKFGTAVDARRLAEQIGTLPDTCVLDDQFSGSLSEIPLSRIPNESVSAGEAIQLSSEFGTYGELLPDSSLYYDSELLSHPFPTPISIDIPGDEFVAMFKPRT